jgi:hypothetical protein
MYVKSVTYTVKYILSVAEVQYLSLFGNGQWTGATIREQASTFPSQQWSNAKLQKCYNFGKPGCRVDICPTLKDDLRIKLVGSISSTRRRKVRVGAEVGAEVRELALKASFKSHMTVTHIPNVPLMGSWCIITSAMEDGSLWIKLQHKLPLQRNLQQMQLNWQHQQNFSPRGGGGVQQWLV